MKRKTRGTVSVLGLLTAITVFPSGGYGAVSIDNASATTGSLSANQKTTTAFTVNPGNYDTMLVVTLGFEDVLGTVNSVTWNNTNMTMAVNTNVASSAAWIWYLDNPEPGNHELTVNTDFTDPDDPISIGFFSLCDVEGSGPVETATFGSTTDDNGVITFTNTPGFGAVSIDVGTCQDGGGSITLGEGQVGLGFFSSSVGGFSTVASYETDCDGTMSQTWNKNKRIGYAAVYFDAAPVLDLDGDGLPANWEASNGLDDNDDGTIDSNNGPDGDPDSDDLSNIDEYIHNTDPRDSDSDHDGIPDGYEFYGYVNIFGPNDMTDMLDPDSDDDGIEDGVETGWTNSNGFVTNPNSADTDFDSMSDLYEVNSGLDPTRDDSDDDLDSDGLSNLYEYTLGTLPGTLDTDGDGLSDGDEVNAYSTNPLFGDTDNDGYSDGSEVANGTDPNNPLSTPVNIPPAPPSGVQYDNALGVTLFFAETNGVGIVTNSTFAVDGNNIDRMLVVSMGHENGSITNVTWGEQSLTLATNAVASASMSSIWYLDDPSGGMLDLTVYSDGNVGDNAADVSMVSLYSVAGSGPAGVAVFESTTTFDASVSFSGVFTNGAYGVDVGTVNGGYYSVTLGDGQELIYTARHGGTGFVTASSYKPGFTGAMSQDWSGGGRIAYCVAWFDGTPFVDNDGDGLPASWEAPNGLDDNDDGSIDPNNGAEGDPDDDILSNSDEYAYGTDPWDNDSDDDGVMDGYEFHGYDNAFAPGTATSMTNPDTDGDGIQDGVEMGVTNSNGFITDPNSSDTDADGLPDLYEVDLGLDPTDATGEFGATGDPDMDGLSNTNEYVLGTNPQDSDSDDDGILDGAEVYGSDNSSYTNAPTDPLNSDSDGDGIPDGEEVNTGVDGYITNPNAADTDGDGYSDALEVAEGADPTTAALYPSLGTYISSVTETNGEPEGISGSWLTGLVFDEDVLAYTDRTHQWNGITANGLPGELVGGDYIMTANDARDNVPYELDVELKAEATLYILWDNRNAIPNWMTNSVGLDFVNTGLLVGNDNNGDGIGAGVSIEDTNFEVWRAYESINGVESTTLPIGTYTLYERGGSGNAMYGVVVTAPYMAPAEAPVISGTVSGGDLTMSWEGGGTYNVLTNSDLTNPNGWSVMTSGTSPITNAIGSEAQLFYKLESN